MLWEILNRIMGRKKRIIGTGLSRPSPSEKPPTRNYCVTEHARTEEGEGLVSKLGVTHVHHAQRMLHQLGATIWRRSELYGVLCADNVMNYSCHPYRYTL